MNDGRYDVAIVGGGPSGASAAMLAARAGLKVALLEKTRFPRFQIGESLLPLTWQLMRKWGILDGMARVPHVPKYGAEFGFGDGTETSVFLFNNSFTGGVNETFNVARADFDDYLLGCAREAGAEIRDGCGVNAIERLDDSGVKLATDSGPVAARYLLDASGHATLVARHLGIRRPLPDEHLRKVAYFAHFEKVRRLPGRLAGCPTIVMSDEGWFWIIPLNQKYASVGLVLKPEVAKSIDVPAKRILRWGIERCPLMRQRLRDAVGPEENIIRADFSYRCDPCAGPGYFLLGDAAAFLDPIFSTGVSVGMAGAEAAVDAVVAILRHGADRRIRRDHYQRLLDRATAPLIRMIRHYYTHGFREMFMNGRGPMKVHQAVLAVLAGQVFPRVRRSVAWRLALFHPLVDLQARFALVPRRPHFSLLKSIPGADPGDAKIYVKTGKIDNPAQLAD